MANRKMNLTVEAPLQGMVRRTPFQHQPPFSAYFSNNFWPLDVDTGRATTATRPALANLAAPGTTVNLLCPINGFASGKPQQSLIAASGGQLYWWDGVLWQLATGASAAAIDTGRAVYASPFLQQAFICAEDAAPIVFDYVAGAADPLVSLIGEAPTDCRMATVHQGALWLAGREEEPHILFGSRTGDAYDWDYAADLADEGGAFATAGQDEGLLNGPITAIHSHTSDTMVVSTVDGIMAMRGHPRRGGVFEQLSGATYILGQGAFCKTPGDVAYFMTPLGLMRLDPTPGAIATPISRRLIPDELMGLTYDLFDPKVSMAYSSRWNGIYISVRGAQAQAWRYDLETGGFDKMTFDNYPFVMYEHKPFVDEDVCGVVWGKS